MINVITKYISDYDFTREFDSYIECEQFEQSQLSLMYGCHFFDEDDNEWTIDIDAWDISLMDAYSECIKLVFDSTDSREWLTEQIGFCSRYDNYFRYPSARTCLSYHMENDEWTEDML